MSHIIVPSLCLISMLLAPYHRASAQDLATHLAATDYHLSYDNTRTLSVDLDALAFFKNNEYGGHQATGYTLPGFWLQPRLAYQPLDAVRLELGCHALIFNGANKYPCFAYHDIARWKGTQYQHGFHVLPFFRAQAHLRDFTFVLGNLYGGANHGLVEPLMNPEVNLSQDPEMGFQLFCDRPFYHLDAWINWQSFIFREDNHQEAFTVGVSQRIRLNKASSPLHVYLPVDVLIQHRGGEIDATDDGVQTIDNGAFGVGLKWNARKRIFNALTAEVMALGCWQQTGELWPFDTGLATAATLRADFLRQLSCFATLFYAKDFCPIYGAPFFSTFSTKTGGHFDNVFTPHLGIEWHHTFAHDYVLGAKIDTYLSHTGRETLPAGYTENTDSEGITAPASSTYNTALESNTAPAAFKNNFSFGIYFRCSPSFRLFKK